MTPEDRKLVEFAEALTTRPTRTRKSEVEALRQAGFSDKAILTATEVVAYFNFVNRLATGLGVELES